MAFPVVHTFILLAATSVSALRQRRSRALVSYAYKSNFMENASSSSEGEGTGVGSLYTYGSPMVAEEPGLSNPARADGCFPGFRIVNQREGVTIDDIDLVAWLLRGTRYRHTKMATLKLFENRLGQRKPSETFPCGWEQGGGLIPSLPEHFIWVYSRRGRDTPNNEVPGLSVLTSVGYDISYNTRVEQVAEEVRSKGWGLVNSAVTGFGWLIVGQQVSHLVQEPTTLRCLLTFEGSDSLVDFIQDVRVVRKPFCGLAQNVHSGFISVIKGMVGSSDFQTKIRPQLQYCNKVDVLGHSLGGASASLFAACSSNPLAPGSPGYDEYEMFSWTPATPRRLDYL